MHRRRFPFSASPMSGTERKFPGRLGAVIPLAGCWAEYRGARSKQRFKMTDFKFNCPQCGQTVEADESFCGQTVECPHCGKGIVVPSIKSSSVSEAKTQPLYCPNCGNACEVDGELAIGQHLICPYCSEMFAYPGTEQGSESFPQDGHAEERRSEEITAKCPHCGTLYEVEQRNLG